MNTPNAYSDAAIAEKKNQAWRLRNTGGSYRLIAKTLGVSVSTAYAWLQADLAELNISHREQCSEYRQKQLEQLATLQIALWKRATDPTHKGQDFAVKQFLAVLKREAALLGLDAAVKLEHTGADGGPMETVTGVTPLSELRERYTPDEAERVARLLVGKLELLAQNTRAVQEARQKASEAAERHGTTELTDPARMPSETELED